MNTKLVTVSAQSILAFDRVVHPLNAQPTLVASVERVPERNAVRISFVDEKLPVLDLGYSAPVTLEVID